MSIARLTLREVDRCDFSQALRAAKEYDIHFSLLTRIMDLRHENMVQYSWRICSAYMHAIVLDCTYLDMHTAMSCCSWLQVAHFRVAAITAYATVKAEVARTKKEGWKPADSAIEVAHTRESGDTLKENAFPILDPNVASGWMFQRDVGETHD